MHDQQAELLSKLKAGAELCDPEIQKEIGEMLESDVPEQDTELCYYPCGDSSKEKKNCSYRHLPEGENATPVAPLRTLDADGVGPCREEMVGDATVLVQNSKTAELPNCQFKTGRKELQG